LVTIAVAGAPSVNAAPRSFYGLQAWTTPGNGELVRMHRGGAGTYRFALLWPVVEPRRGARHWAAYDEVVARVARAGLRMLPVLHGSPPFAARRPQYPPRSRRSKRAFARFLRDAVRRYGRRGRFWRERPDVPKRPITAWQIWNEPNYPAYWNGHPSARGYASLLRSARSAIKKADRRAKVVVAGLPQTRNRRGVPMTRYLAALYRRGARRLFDVVAVNSYSRSASGVIRTVRRARSVMRRGGDRRKQVWVTEVGWGTDGRANGFSAAYKTTQAGQATRLTEIYRGFARARRRLRVGMVVWFSWRDRAPGAGEDNWWGINTGLFGRSGSPKPAWQAFARVSGGNAGAGSLSPAPASPVPGLPPAPPPSAGDGGGGGGSGGGGGGGCTLIIIC